LIYAQASEREFSVYDPWVNMLRSNAAIFSATLGGANNYLIQGHDKLTGESENSRRLSENMVDMLKEESHLNHVIDPMQGSYALEDLTCEMTEYAWQIFKGEEPDWEKLASETLEKRKELIWNQKSLKTGSTSFANPDEVEAGQLETLSWRPLFDLEKLRQKLQGMKLALVIQGSQAKLSARMNFCYNFFEVVGVKITEFEDFNFNQKEYAATILCAVDNDYTQEMVDQLSGLIFVAGSPVNELTGVTAFGMRSNLMDTLSKLGEL
jgi:methylmalonyl-CoA mutase